MATSVGSLILFASELQAALEFYRTVGLDLKEETHDGPAAQTGPAHYAGDLGGCHVAIFDAADHPLAPARAPEFRSPGSCYVGFTVEHVAKTVESLRLLGAHVVQEAEQYPWGVRALVEDPDGRIIELFESSATVKP